MTRDEAMQVLTRMMSVWPSVELPDATVRYWLEFLYREPASYAVETVDMLALESKWFPTVAEYQTVARRVVAQAMIRKPVVAIGAGRASKEVAAKWIEECRATLKSRRSGGTREEAS